MWVIFWRAIKWIHHYPQFRDITGVRGVFEYATPGLFFGMIKSHFFCCWIHYFLIYYFSWCRHKLLGLSRRIFSSFVLLTCLLTASVINFWIPLTVLWYYSRGSGFYLSFQQSLCMLSNPLLNISIEVDPCRRYTFVFFRLRNLE